MTVLIAGASGFIGARLSEYLAAKGFQIIALYNSNKPTDIEWIAGMNKLISIDISRYESVEKLAEFEIDAIVNLVSLNHHDSNGNPDFVNGVNVTPTWNFLHLFSKRKPLKFIYLSTIHIYGNNLDGRIFENTKPSPLNAYGLTHLLSEKVADFFSSNSDLACYNLRLSNGYGAPKFMENSCWDLVINNLCLNAFEKKELILKSDGTPIRDFIHLSDVCEGIYKILLKNESFEKKSATTINFSSGKTISMLDAAWVVKSVYLNKFGKEAEVYINGNNKVLSHQMNDASKYIIDNSLFLEYLEQSELTSLEKGVSEIFDYLINRP